MNRFLCIILLSSSIKAHSPHFPQASIQLVPVGSTVTIPCEGYGDRTSAKWVYRGEDINFATIIQEKKGLILKGKALGPRKRTLKDFYLEISPFTELDKGTYICEVCTNPQSCTVGKLIYLSVAPQDETYSSSLKTHVVIKGGRLSYSCHQNVTLKVRWTFEAHGGNTATQVKSEQTNNSLLFIPDVQPSHAGKYSCWSETSTGQRRKVYSVTVCVFTVTAEELTDSAQNCTLYCDLDMEAEENPIIIETENWNISLTGRIKKPKSSVICILHSSGAKPDRTSHEEVTNQSDATAYVTVDSSSSHLATLISTCVAVFFIIVAFVIIFWILLQKGCQSVTERSEDETQVIYSTLQCSRLQQQSTTTSADECVYSQIKV